MSNDYFYDGMGEQEHGKTCTHLNSLVQDGRGIFRMAIIENKRGQTLPSER